MQRIALENRELSVSLTPDFGARIISLCDKQTGRDWIAAGPCIGSAAADATFGPKTATGWDECFPTVGACVSPDGIVWRDHGDLWGRPWEVAAAASEHATTIFHHDGYRFERTLTLAGASLHCRYLVENLADKPLDYLWAKHALLALNQDDCVELPSGTPCRVTHRTDGRAAGAIAWPGGADFSLDRVQPIGRRFAAKLLIDNGPVAGVRIGDAAGSLLIAADARFAGSTGIWLCYGGWPGADHIHQVAIEPTSAPADDLAGAMAMGRAVAIEPGRSVSWWTRLTLGPGLAAR